MAKEIMDMLQSIGALAICGDDFNDFRSANSILYGSKKRE